MIYNKPGIAVLGNAAKVIQQMNPKTAGPNEPWQPWCLQAPDPAYDVDE